MTRVAEITKIKLPSVTKVQPKLSQYMSRPRKIVITGIIL
jgi:hypothetical protein